jgi:hypothetical protein
MFKSSLILWSNFMVSNELTCLCLRGYLAPEVRVQGQLTKKANVYSFGVLMLEIISGRCHTDPRPPLEDQYLLEKVKNNGEIHRYFIDFIPI